KATSEGEFKKKMGELKSFNSDAYDWLMKIPLEQWSRAYFLGRAKCDLLINNICKVFNRQLVDGKDPHQYLFGIYHRVLDEEDCSIIGPYKDQYVVNMDRRVCSCRKWELTGIPCKHVMAAIYNMSENSVGLAVESRTVIIPPLYKSPIGRPPKKRKKSNDEIASQSASSDKLSRKGKLVSCGKCGNVGHNRKGCKGQGGGSSQAGARKVYGQAAGATNVSSRSAGARKVSGQAVGATNVSGQAVGGRKVSGQVVGSKKVSSQAANARKASSQPSAAQSTAKQGPGQGFQGPIAGPSFGSQRKTKKLVDL
ncbi:mutator type transposase, partial [Tanacetum coccineum]